MKKRTTISNLRVSESYTMNSTHNNDFSDISAYRVLNRSVKLFDEINGLNHVNQNGIATYSKQTAAS